MFEEHITTVHLKLKSTRSKRDNMDSRMSSRMGFLRQCAIDYPAQRANIEAIIRYYEAGGQLPEAGVEVVYCFDGENVKVGSNREYMDEHVARKTVGWADVRYSMITSARLPSFR
jgi:hypothetical protein